MSNIWESIGTIVLQDERLIVPKIPAVSGLYRLRFDDNSVYIGEATDISRRIGDYITYYRSVGIESEFRINKKLLDSKDGTEIWVLLDDSYSSHSARCVREHQEIKKARAEGSTVLNGGKIEDRIAFFESEIERLREKLQLKKQLEEGHS